MNDFLKNAKVAFCFSGQLRSFKDTYKIINRNLISHFQNPEIFFSTWEDDPNLLDYKFFYNLSEKVNISLFPQQNYDYVIEKINKVKQFSNKNNILNQLFLLKMCNELKKKEEIKNNFKYDLVFRCRPDIVYLNSIKNYDFRIIPFLDNTRLSENINNNNLFCNVEEPSHRPSELKVHLNENNNITIDDIFYFGNSQLMDIVCSRYDFVDEYVSNKYPFHPELFFGYTVFKNLKKENIYRIHFPRAIIR
jgi:hypothetical protein